MAQFSNSDAGSVFDNQCTKCKYGQHACPIQLVQMEYNYKSYSNDDLKNLLNELVKQDGTCTIFEMAKKEFAIDPNQLSLFN